jgi:hypothetical protein
MNDTFVNDMELDRCECTKPMMNGMEQIEFLGLEKGLAVGVYSEEQNQWRLMNPKGSVDELKSHLKDVHTGKKS